MESGRENSKYVFSHSLAKMSCHPTVQDQVKKTTLLEVVGIGFTATPYKLLLTKHLPAIMREERLREREGSYPLCK
jgi:hypothetical protein